MVLIDDLLASEEKLSSADVDCDRETCQPDAVFVRPGMVTTLDETLVGLEQSPPWDHFDLTNTQLRKVGSHGVAIICRFTGSRGAMICAADMVSTYDRSQGR